MYSSPRTFRSILATCFFLAIAFGCLPSCSRPPQANGNAEPSTPEAKIEMRSLGAPEVESELEPSREMTNPEPAPVMQAPHPAKKGKPPQVPIASTKAFGLAVPAAPLFPADFEIGPLQDLAPPDEEEAAIVGTIRSFLDALVNKKTAMEAALPERRFLIESLVEPLLGPTPVVAYRLGMIERDGDAALARVRLEGKAAAVEIGGRVPAPRVAGELRLRREAGSWFVEDIAFDPSGLAGETPGRSGRFEPGMEEP